jgi:antitoxin YefM
LLNATLLGRCRDRFTSPSFDSRIPFVKITLLCAIINVQLSGTYVIVQQTASPTDARKNFFALIDQVAADHQVVIVKRRDGENVALIAESDLNSLYETAYLLKSPANAQRLYEALERSKARDDQPVVAISTAEAIAQLRQELEIGQEKGKA